MKRLRAFLESIAFAGLKPGQKSGARARRSVPLSGAVDRFLSAGPSPNDPLYLTNRPIQQKMRSWVIIGLPCLILAAGIGLALSNLLDPPRAKEIAEPTSKEVAAGILPNLNPDLKLRQNNEIEVVEVRVEQDGSSKLIGVVRNMTNHEVPIARLVIDLTDGNSSQVG